MLFKTNLKNFAHYVNTKLCRYKGAVVYLQQLCMEDDCLK